MYRSKSFKPVPLSNYRSAWKWDFGIKRPSPTNAPLKINIIEHDLDIDRDIDIGSQGRLSLFYELDVECHVRSSYSFLGTIIWASGHACRFKMQL